MEFFDIYTADRQKTGKTMARGEKQPDGAYRIVVHIVVFNSDGKMLIQQRQSFKRNFPDMWDVTAGGVVTTGETSRQGAERELFEEMGIKVSFEGISPYLTINSEHAFHDYYILKRDIAVEDLRLQPEEVKSAKWADKAEILYMLENGEFVPYKDGLFELLFSFCDGRGSIKYYL